MDIPVLCPGDDGLVAAASHLFDGPARADATARFIADDTHHLLIAYEDERPAGFVSGVEVTHPDKGTEMFVYELAVDEPFRRRGIGRALLERLAMVARGAGCYGMWVLTDEDNVAGRRGLDLLTLPNDRPHASASTSWSPEPTSGGPPGRVSTASPALAPSSSSKTTTQVPVPARSLSHRARTNPGSDRTSGITNSSRIAWRSATSEPGSISTCTSAA